MDLASAPGIYHTNLVLAGHYLTLSASSQNCSQFIQWNDKEFAEAKEYQVERSYDGADFERIASLPVNGKALHSYTDNNSPQAISYYRVKVLLESGITYYSSVVYSAKSCSEEKVSLYPNPVKDQLTVSMTYKVSEITIYAASGKEFGKWPLNGNNLQVKLDLSNLPAGQYFIRLKDASGGQKAYPVLKL
jgi:hypothetical protein